MAELKKRITYKELSQLEKLPWKSWKTTVKKIKTEGFPAYLEDGRYSFDLDEIEVWFKRRKFVAA